MNSCRHFPEGCVVPGLRLAVGLELAETRLLGSGLGRPSLRSAVPCSGPRPPPTALQPGGQEGGWGWGLLPPNRVRGGSGSRHSQVMLQWVERLPSPDGFGGSLGSHAHLWLSALPSLKGAW